MLLIRILTLDVENFMANIPWLSNADVQPEKRVPSCSDLLSNTRVIERTVGSVSDALTGTDSEFGWQINQWKQSRSREMGGSFSSRSITALRAIL